MEVGPSAETDKRTLAEALKGADVFFGVSAKGALTPDMVKTMAATDHLRHGQPRSEILPEEVYAVRPDAIVATGAVDYPNQVNNVLAFPYLFRGALDVRARRSTMEMKVAAAKALARWRARTCPTRWPPPITAPARSSGRSTSSPCRSTRGCSRRYVSPWPRRRWTPAWRASRSPTWTHTPTLAPRLDPGRLEAAGIRGVRRQRKRRLRRGRGGA